jgi:hypothetical protein
MSKIIVYNDAESNECTVTPAENKRRITGVTIRPRNAVQAWQMEAVFRHIAEALDGAEVIFEWAESEQQFLERISAKDVPSAASNVRFVEKADYEAEQEDKVKAERAKARELTAAAGK